jgi:replicative DNA helicase
MHVVGARPGMGKTTVLLNLMDNLCTAGRGVGIISLEMDHLELMAGIYAFQANINSRRFKEKLGPEEWDGVRYASSKVKNWNLQVDDCSLLDVNGLRHKARKMVANGAEVLEIDYLQLLQAPDDSRKVRNRAEDVAEMSRTIKLLAKELHIPIIVGAQLNREAAGSAPGSHMLRESGAVEQDADVIILLRQKDEEARGEQVSILWNIAKWRGGVAGFDLEFLFNKPRQRFMDSPQKGFV